MSPRKLFQIVCVTLITLVFVTTPLHAKPKEEKDNQGKANAPGQVHKSEKKNLPQNKHDKASGHTGMKMNNADRGHIIHKEKDASQAKALRPDVQIRLEHRMEQASRKNERELIRNLNRSLLKLSQSNWSYHPRDERGQGNMGKVDMLDPFGHDQDSDRKELYGNRGRVIRDVVPEPEPEPEPVPEPEPIPEPDPEPEPQPEPPPPTDPLPDFPF